MILTPISEAALPATLDRLRQSLADGLPRQVFSRIARLAHAARADFCRRLGDAAKARAAYERALALAHVEPEQRFLRRRLAELPT